MLLVVGSCLIAFSQTRGFNYQAVLRDADGNINASASIQLRFTIYQGAIGPMGLIVYRETQNLTTNTNGLINTEIGGGTVVTGDFDLIDWPNGDYNMLVEIDQNGSWNNLSEVRLLAVPFAKHAEIADSVVNFPALTNYWTENNGALENNNGGARVNINDVSINPSGIGAALIVDSVMQLSNSGEITAISTNGAGQMELKVNNINNDPIMTIDDNGDGVIIDEELTVRDQITVLNNTTNPAPRSIYGNSMPIAYGYTTGLGLQTSYGVSGLNSSSTGIYTITLNNSLAGNPVVIATPFDAVGLEHAVHAGGSGNTIEIRTYDATGNLTNTNFSFVVFGTAAP